MHEALANEILRICRQRALEGDCPTVDAPGREMLEDCIIELASQRDAAKRHVLQTLAEAMMKFAPDLTKEICRRWETAKADQDAALEALLQVLRR